jgi:predicted nucleotidyltransferase component of viral defense system
MQNLIKQEQFEIEVLDCLNSRRLLDKLVFTGGTMLRLCHGLNRFSVDLDFWVIKRVKVDRLFESLKRGLSSRYSIRDSAGKFYTLLFEIKSKDYPRSLKIEIRKEPRKIKIEKMIAYTRYSNLQVFVNTVSLRDMMTAKIRACLERKEIRDIFDIEFLFKKGVPPEAPLKDLEGLLKVMHSLTKNDYAVKLGSLLEAGERRYYQENKFRIIESEIINKINLKKHGHPSCDG